MENVEADVVVAASGSNNQNMSLGDSSKQSDTIDNAVVSSPSIVPSMSSGDGWSQYAAMVNADNLPDQTVVVRPIHPSLEFNMLPATPEITGALSGEIEMENLNRYSPSKQTEIINSNQYTAQGDAGPSRRTERIKHMYSRIYKAAEKGLFDDVLVSEGSTLENLLTPNGNTVLHIHITAQYAHGKGAYSLDFMNKILGACPNLFLQPNEKGEIPLHMAARYGRHHTVKFLIEHAEDFSSVDVERGAATRMLEVKNGEGDMALHEAVRYNHLNVVELLLITKDTDPHLPNFANNAGETPLYLAAERGFDEVLTKILGTRIAKQSGGPHRRTALHAAVIGNYKAITEKLLENMGHVIEEADFKGWTPLHYAAHLGHVLMVQLILQHDVSAAYLTDGDGRTALHIAASCGYRDIVTEFLSRCPDCCELVDKRGWNILHFAAEVHDESIVSDVLKNFSLSNLLNEKDCDGNTPLHQFAFRKSCILKFINDPRVDKMAFNNKNLNALDISLSKYDLPYPHDQVFKILSARLKWAGARVGLRNIIYEDDVKEATENENSIIEQVVKARESHLLAATLVATVSFAACITLPGGYFNSGGSKEGSAILTGKVAFNMFVMSNMTAMVFSTMAVFLHLVLSLQVNKKIFLKQFIFASFFTTIAMISMMLAAWTALIAVLNLEFFKNIPSIAISTIFIGVFFCSSWYYVPLRLILTKINKWQANAGVVGNIPHPTWIKYRIKHVFSCTCLGPPLTSLGF